MKNKREAIFVASVFLFALALRFAYTNFLEQHYLFYQYPSDDVLYYQKWASDIIHGTGQARTVFYGMPLYPYFLVFLKFWTLNNFDLIRLIHLLLGSLNCVLIYILVKRLFSPKTASLSMLLAATNFVLIYFDWLMMPITLLIFINLSIAIALTHLDEATSLRKKIILGILIGLGCLGEGKLVVFIPLMFIYFAVHYRKKLLWALNNIIFPIGIGLLIIFLIVTLRNRIVGGDWVFVNSHNGFNLYFGNNPKASGLFENTGFIRPDHEGQDKDQQIIAEAALKRHLKPSEASRFWQDKALDFIFHNPKKYVTLLAHKVYLCSIENEKAHNIDLLLQKRWKDAWDVNSFSLIFPLAILGIVIARKKEGAVFLNFLLLSYVLFVLIFFHTTRHRATSLPFLIIYESFALCWIYQKAREKKILTLGMAILFLFLSVLILRPEPIDPQVVEFVRATKTGIIFEDQNQFDNARREYRHALELQPLDIPTLYNLGNTYLKEHNLKNAMEYYERALRLYPHSPDVLYNLAYAYEEIGDIKKALENYQKVLELEPDSVDAHVRMTKIFLNQQDCTNASIHANALLKISPSLTKNVNQLMAECSGSPTGKTVVPF